VAIEIERKFLVVSEDWRQDAETSVHMIQGYLAETDTCSVRVRVAGDRAWLNFKGLTVGARRTEFDYPVPLADAREMLELYCGDRLIEKVRHYARVGQDVWEIDVFAGDNAGLVVAEIELASEDQEISIPGWLGEEVTSDPRYYNIRLVEEPYSEWTDA
jgi:adenylate cyclase